MKEWVKEKDDESRGKGGKVEGEKQLRSG